MKIVSGFFRNRQRSFAAWGLRSVTFRRRGATQNILPPPSAAVPSRSSGSSSRGKTLFSPHRLWLYALETGTRLSVRRGLMENKSHRTAFNCALQISSLAKPHCWENKTAAVISPFPFETCFVLLPRRHCVPTVFSPHARAHSHTRCTTSHKHKCNRSLKSVAYRSPTYEAVNRHFSGDMRRFPTRPRRPRNLFPIYSRARSRDCHHAPLLLPPLPPSFDLRLPPGRQSGASGEKHKHHYHDGPSPGVNLRGKRAPFFLLRDWLISGDI